jgi:GNAT superfamily N-acetyltransferase
VLTIRSGTTFVELVMPPDELVWQTTDDPPRRDVEELGRSLDAFNHAAADLGGVRVLACFARSHDGGLVGGALARTWGRCCEIQQVWVRETHRRGGVGGRLVRTVEEEARRRGCTLVFLETFSFQAPDLYRRMGFECVCEFAGFPDGIVKYVMRKLLV